MSISILKVYHESDVINEGWSLKGCNLILSQILFQKSESERHQISLLKLFNCASKISKTLILVLTQKSNVIFPCKQNRSQINVCDRRNQCNEINT